MPNVLLVTIDSLRPDYLGCYSDWARAEGLSPHLDEWARSACLFETAISQGPRTPEAFPAILSGQYASRYRDVFGGLSPERRLISEILKEHGYACAAFNSNPYISRQMGYSRGFDLYEDNLMVGRRQGLAGNLFIHYFKLRNLLREPYVPAPQLNRQALGWLRDAPRPFFLWVHYMDVHGPYIPKRGFRPLQRLRAGLLWRKATHHPERITAAERKTLIAAYKEEIRFTDRFLAELLGSIDSRQTLVIITADHGELLGEHGLYAHTFKLYDTLLKVPLLVRLPGQDKPVVVRRMVRSLDIAPSVIDLLGLPGDHRFDGESFRPLLNGSPDGFRPTHAISEIWTTHLCVREERFKLIANYAEGEKELFELRADPGEERNVIGQHEQEAGRLEARLHEHLLSIKAPEDDLRRAGILEDEEVKSRLESLGYM
jgi:arylsulfatase